MPVAIVTGSARGIGRGIALRLARDGFCVVVADVASQKGHIDQVVAAVKATGQKSHGVVADVSVKDQVEALVAETISVFGELNVMVANAGILETTSVLELSVEQWERTMSVNIRGVFLCHTAAARQMVKQGKGGKLIAACSISGYRPSGKAPAYCTSKWAVRGFTQTCALELGQYGITVNAYCPGSVFTDMFLGTFSQDDLYLQPVKKRNTMNMAMWTEPAHKAVDTTMMPQAMAIDNFRPRASAHQELNKAPKNPPA